MTLLLFRRELYFRRGGAWIAEEGDTALEVSTRAGAIGARVGLEFHNSKGGHYRTSIPTGSSVNRRRI